MTIPEEVDTPPWTTGCPCAPCKCRRLAHPHLNPTAAETWLTTNPTALGHLDSRRREEYTEHFGYAILNRPTVELIRPYAPLLEVASGIGYWAHELQQNGICTVPTDLNPENLWPDHTPWTQTARMDGLQALNRYPNHNLLLCWPEMRDWPTHVVENFSHQHLIYVGERREGCTGLDTMFDALDRSYDPVTEHEIPTFTGSNDRLIIFRRRGPKA